MNILFGFLLGQDGGLAQWTTIILSISYLIIISPSPEAWAVSKICEHLC